MRRVPILLAVVAVVLLGALAVSRAANTAAQDATPQDATPPAAPRSPPSRWRPA